jgi:YVTN family beta-propeller protein
LALTSDGRRLVVVNRPADTVSIIEVRDAQGQDTNQLVQEVSVGHEPRQVVISPNDSEAYVTNTASGTVSVIQLTGPNAFRTSSINVGTEPRGCALTPNGTRLYVANHTAGTVSVIDTSNFNLIGTVNLGGNPTAVAITNNGDTSDTDETVFVTQFYAELIPGGPGEVFDNGKQGVVFAFQVGSPGSPVKIPLAPVANVGFTADRSLFCTKLNANAHSDVFCPDANETNPAATSITADPQGAYPNQLHAALIRFNGLFIPSIGAGPEPPIRFNVNVQALIHVVNTGSEQDIPSLTVNLNDQIKTETQPDNVSGSLQRLFANDIVDIDADSAGETFLIVSRGGNCVLRAALDNSSDRLTLGAPNSVVRFQTGNLPTGVVINSNGTRAYVNNEVNTSVTAINLENNTVIARDIPASNPPVPGTDAHKVLLGKLAFFTALGVPDNGIFNTPLRDIVPLNDRNKASDNGWSGCGSCHPDGLADGVTWSFGTGPRQTVPLDGSFNHNDQNDQRIFNYSAVMGSITDFNNNSRNVQGGKGFAGDPPNPAIFSHGATQGASEGLDAMTIWARTIRAPIMPEPTDEAAINRAEGIFEDQCASCHGGAKWTKSRIVYQNNPTFNADPAAGGVKIDPGLENAGPQIVSFTRNGDKLQFLEPVDSFDANDQVELRGAGAQSGQAALGGLGFNVPSLLGAGYHLPYLHNGAAQTLDELFNIHALGGGTISSELDAGQRADLKAFLNALDEDTQTFDSQTDDFLGN